MVKKSTKTESKVKPRNLPVPVVAEIAESEDQPLEIETMEPEPGETEPTEPGDAEPTEPDDTLPTTGENFRIHLWLILLLVVAGGLLLFFNKKKLSRQKD